MQEPELSRKISKGAVANATTNKLRGLIIPMCDVYLSDKHRRTREHRDGRNWHVQEQEL